MALRVEIDADSGFCGGVIRAISNAEAFLDAPGHDRLYSLGAIVHNEAELERLSSKGLVTLDDKAFSGISDAAGETLLIRAHGEPPVTFERAAAKGFEVIDCTCPVVLHLQGMVRDAYSRLHSCSPAGTIVIFGKIGHAEILGLMGQAGGDVLVVDSPGMLSDALEKGLVDLSAPVEVFSQTTGDPSLYSEVCSLLRENMSDPALLTVHDTICRQVASRHSQLAGFALSHNVIVFVSGRESSNGKVLCGLCSSRNERTYHIAGPSEIRAEWFRDGDSVGICGATSTPKWLLEQVAEAVARMQ